MDKIAAALREHGGDYRLLDDADEKYVRGIAKVISEYNGFDEYHVKLGENGESVATIFDTESGRHKLIVVDEVGRPKFDADMKDYLEQATGKVEVGGREIPNVIKPEEAASFGLAKKGEMPGFTVTLKNGTIVQGMQREPLIGEDYKFVPNPSADSITVIYPIGGGGTEPIEPRVMPEPVTKVPKEMVFDNQQVAEKAITSTAGEPVAARAGGGGGVGDAAIAREVKTAGVAALPEIKTAASPVAASTENVQSTERIVEEVRANLTEFGSDLSKLSSNVSMNAGSQELLTDMKSKVDELLKGSSGTFKQTYAEIINGTDLETRAQRMKVALDSLFTPDQNVLLADLGGKTALTTEGAHSLKFAHQGKEYFMYFDPEKHGNISFSIEDDKVTAHLGDKTAKVDLTADYPETITANILRAFKTRALGLGTAP